MSGDGWITLRRLARPNVGWAALLAAMGLSAMGIMAIATAAPRYAAVQARWLVIALVAAGLCALPSPRVVGRLAYLFMGLILVALVVVLIPVMPRWIVPVRNGARCWINLQFMMFQPSELAKVLYVLSMAWYLRYGGSWRTVWGLCKVFVLLLIPLSLILLEPDLGSALLFPPTLFAMLVAAGARLTHLGALVGMALLAVVVNIATVFVLPDSMQVLKPHQRQRIVALVSQIQGDTRYENDIGYQQAKAMTLVGSGGLRGYGAERSRTIVRYNKLPEDHNDMIFAVIVNRWGWLGGMATLGLYLLMVYSMFAVAMVTKNAFTQISAVGFAGLIFSQAMINIGITLGLLPVTGITLPFVSYGGSSLVAMFAVIGLMVNFASWRPVMLARPNFEFDRADAAVS